MNRVLKTLLFMLLLGSALAQVVPSIPNTVPYEDHGIYSINLQNLSIVLNVPVRSKSGVNGFNASYTDVLNSLGTAGNFAFVTPISTRADSLGVNALLGKRVTVGYTTTIDQGLCLNGIDHKIQLSGFYVRTADGVQHPLGSTYVYESPSCASPTSFSNQVTTDGSGYSVSYDQTTFSVVSANGDTTGTITLPASPFSVADSNGNLIYANSTYSTYTDTLGTTALTSSGGGAVPSYTWTDVNGGNKSITFTTTSKVQSTAWGCPTPYADTTRAAAPYVTKVSYPDNTNLSIAYETSPGGITGRVSSLTLRTGGVVSFGYTGINCQTDSQNYVGYIAPSQMTQTINGKTWTYLFTPILTTTAPIYLTGNTTTVTDPAGNKTVYTFRGLRNSPALVQVQQYQGASTLLLTKQICYNTNMSNCDTATPTYPVTETDTLTTLGTMASHNRVQQRFDSYGNTINYSTYDFGSSSYAFSTTNNYGTWNGTQCAPIVGIADKVCESITVSGDGNFVADTRASYDADGNQTDSYAWNGSTFLHSSATYNPIGTVATTTSVAGTVTNYTYNACSGAFPTDVTVAGLTSHSAWDCNGGVKTSDTDVNGNVTTYGYKNSSGVADPFWRLSSVTDPLLTTTYKIYGSNTVETKTSFGSSVQDTISTVDGYGRPIRTQTKHGSSYDTISTNYGFNTTGATVSTSIPCLVALGADCTTGFTTTTADGAGRSSTVVDGNSGTTTTTYPQNDVVTTLSPAPTGEHNKVAQVEFDGIGRTKSVCGIQTSGGTLCNQVNGGSGVVTTAAYSTAPGSSTVTQTRGAQVHTTVKDALGRVTSTTTPEEGTVTYVYDSDSGDNCGTRTNLAGALAKVTASDGSYQCYIYDSLGRLTDVGNNTQTTYNPVKRFRYDATLNAYITPPTDYTASNINGRLMEAETETVQGVPLTDEWFSYDDNGRLTDVWEKTPHSGGYYHTTVAYSPNGVPSTLTGIPGYSAYTITLDGDGAPNSSTLGTTTIVRSVTRNAAGQPTSIGFGTSNSDTYTYDANTGQMKTYTFTAGSISDSGTLTWNANGTLKSLAIVDGFNAGGTQTCTFSYDDLTRLLTDNCGSVWNQTYTYVDQYDNMTKSGNPGTSWNQTYSAINNQISGASYDARGNVLYDLNNTYRWDVYGKLSSAQSGTSVAVCGTSGTCATYDAFGRMVEKSVDATYSEILFGPIGRLAMMSGATSVTSATLPNPGGGSTYFSGAGGATQQGVQHLDWLGNNRLQTALNSTTVYADNAFTPYGEVYDSFGTVGASRGKFTGDFHDLYSAALWDTPNRELDFAAGSRWLSPDPAHASWNAYSYPTNPNSQTDRSGLSPRCCIALGSSQAMMFFMDTANSESGDATAPANHPVPEGWSSSWGQPGSQQRFLHDENEAILFDDSTVYASYETDATTYHSRDAGAEEIRISLLNSGPSFCSAGMSCAIAMPTPGMGDWWMEADGSMTVRATSSPDPIVLEQARIQEFLNTIDSAEFGNRAVNAQTQGEVIGNLRMARNIRKLQTNWLDKYGRPVDPEQMGADYGTSELKQFMRGQDPQWILDMIRDIYQNPAFPTGPIIP